MKSGTNEVRKWYNEFSGKQIKTGINLRHYCVFNQIVASGLKKDHNILEVGCGIGTLTTLLCKYVRKGNIVATDISDESIRIAKTLLAGYGNVKFFVSDMHAFEYPEKFDFIILADVLEHIPSQDHSELFKVLVGLMHAQSKLIIHIPHPKLIEYLRKTAPEELQVIDQALHADGICRDAYVNKLILEKYRAYSIFHGANDYVYIQMKLNTPEEYKTYRKRKIIKNKLRERFKFIRVSKALGL